MAAPLDKRLIQRATAVRFFLIAVAIIGIATSALVIVQAWLIARAVSGVFATKTIHFDGPFPHLIYYVIALLAIFVLRAILSWLTAVAAHRCSASVKSTLRTDICSAHLQNSSDSTSSATMIHLVTSGLDALDGYFERYLPQLVMAAFIPLMIVATIWIYDVRSALIIIATIPLIPIFMILIGLATQEAIDKRYRLLTRLSNHFADLIAGLPTLQVFGRARAQRQALMKAEDDFRSVTMKTLRMAFLSGGVLELLATLSVALVAVTIGFRVVAGELDLYTSLFILILAPEAYLPIRMVGVHFHDSANGSAAASAAFDLIEAAQSRPHGRCDADDLSCSRIVMDDVRVEAREGKDRLQGCSLIIEPGQTVAIIGTTGAGKSTALSALMGFVPLDGGSITIAGKELSEIDLPSWHRQIAWVGQNPGMIRGTIADNVAMGGRGRAVSAEVIRSALDRCGAAHLDAQRSVGDDGEGLSAGERRRVALARALVAIECANARLLIMDEPTAGLDQTTEAAVISTLKSLGVTVVVVTHRESILAIADQIVRIDQGISTPQPVPTPLPAEEI